MKGRVRNAPDDGAMPVFACPSSTGPYETWLGYAQREYLTGSCPGGSALFACAGSADKSRAPRAPNSTTTRMALETTMLTVRLRTKRPAPLLVKFRK